MHRDVEGDEQLRKPIRSLGPSQVVASTRYTLEGGFDVKDPLASLLGDEVLAGCYSEMLILQGPGRSSWQESGKRDGDETEGFSVVLLCCCVIVVVV